MALIAKFKNSYKKTGNDGVLRDINVFTVQGSQAELDAYKAAMDEQLTNGCIIDADTGQPLFISPGLLPQVLQLQVTTNNKVVVLNDPINEISKFMNDARIPDAIKTAYASQMAAKFGAQTKVPAFAGSSNARNAAEPPADQAPAPTRTYDPMEDEFSDSEPAESVEETPEKLDKVGKQK